MRTRVMALLREPMRRCFGLAAFVTAIVLLHLSACRPKAKPAPASASATVTATATALVTAKPVASASLRYFESKPVDLEVLAPRRARANEAFRRALDKQLGANDSMAALARALFESPGSAVAALELTKAAWRAHDPNRFGRYLRIAERATASFPVLAKSTEAILAAGAQHQGHISAYQGKSGPVPTREVSGVARFEDLCGWLLTSFKEGRPPVEYVGEQDTTPADCQLSAPQTLAPELKAATAVVRVGTSDERVFAWIVASAKEKLWLSPVVAESFAPAVHPHGNGFSIEIQRAEAYKAGLPELTAYIADRSTVLDLILNEQVLVDRHRVVVMTFDGPTPWTSQAIVVHSRTARALIDPSEPRAPKGYKHSSDLGRTTEETFRLEWGDNQVRLASAGTPGTQSKVVKLFPET